MLLIANRMADPTGVLVDLYARRMVTEYSIASAIHRLHGHALPAAAPVRGALDPILTVIAAPPPRRFRTRQPENGIDNSRARTRFRIPVNANAITEIKSGKIIDSLDKHTNGPLMRAARNADIRQTIPQHQDRVFRIRFH